MGLAAVHVLNHLGYNVLTPPWSCCGRPALSKGVLHHAKENAHRLSEQLKNLPKNTPIISLEPSCLSLLHDEFPALLENGVSTEHCLLFDTFIARHTPLNLHPPFLSVAIHGHCHQKALQGLSDTLHLLHTLPNLRVLEIPSGCCGMAGSFGHEKEHAEFSQKIGELILLPFIRGLPDATPVIANGYSCRHQILQHTGRKALHLAEYLALGLTQDYLKEINSFH